MVIDGSLGTGKTRFCNKLIKLMNKERRDKYYPIYIKEFTNDPLYQY